MGAVWSCCSVPARGAALMTHDPDMHHTSGLWWGVRWEQIANGAAQAPTELFEQVQTDILLAHLAPMQGRFGPPHLSREVPMWGLASSPSDFAC